MGCSVTPNGNRVTVYLDNRLAQNLNIEAQSSVFERDSDISVGLLHSLCFIPILSYGATAPLANTPQGQVAGWAAEPLGLARLEGEESDREDGVLKVVRAFLCTVAFSRCLDLFASVLNSFFTFLGLGASSGLSRTGDKHQQ